MPHLNSHRQTETCTTRTMSGPTTPAPLPNLRKLANKQRRQAGRERHDERKAQLKAHEERRVEWRIDHSWLRQEKRRVGRARGLKGWNLDNVNAFASHCNNSSDTDLADDLGSEEEEEEEEGSCSLCGGEFFSDLDDGGDVSTTARSATTSGMTLLAMARPAKRHHSPLAITDGEAFEVVEIDGRLVALDEDGWEILPDENGELSVLYSDVVRGSGVR